MVPEIQNNGISIKLYPGNNLYKIVKENVVLLSDSKAHLKKCLNVMNWMDVKPLSKMSAGHKLDGHKNCQKCLQVMRWMDTNIVKSVCRSKDGWTQTLSKVSAGHEMDEHKHCQKCLQVMRWKDTNTVKGVCRS